MVVAGMVFQGMEGFDLDTARRLSVQGLEADGKRAASKTPPDHTDMHGRTLLHQAAASGDSHACRSLLAVGVDAKRLDNDGRAASDHARSAGHFELAAALEGRIETQAEISARAPLTTRELIGLVRDDAKIFEEMISLNRLAARDAKGDTALHIVAMRGKMLACDMLVSAGADIRATNSARQTPSAAAHANGFELLADLLATFGNRSVVEQPKPIFRPAPPPEVLLPIAVAIPVSQSGSTETDAAFASLDDLDFDAVTGAQDFHDSLERTETNGGFERIPGDIRVQAELGEEQADWEIGQIGGGVEGDGISRDTDAGRVEQQPALTGRRGLRRPAQPSSWHRFAIDAEGCRQIVERIVQAGHLSDDDLGDLLGLCAGRFDPVDLARNLEREFEAAGFSRAEEQADIFWEAPTAISVDDLTEAILATCSRNIALPGATAQVPDQKALQRLTATLIEARRTMLVALAEKPESIDIILYMADRVMEEEVAPESISALSFSPAHQSSDRQQFLDAIEVLRVRRPHIAGGSSRAIRATADALELLELRTDFLRDVAATMSEAPALVSVASKLDRDLDGLERSSKAILHAFVPLCRRFAAQNATEDEDHEDLFQVAFFGLRRAVIRFKPELGTNFVTYASAWLRQSVTRWRSDERRLIRLPVQREGLLAECRRAAETIEARYLRDASSDEIAAELRRGPELAAVLSRLPLEAVGLDQLDHDPAEADNGGIPEAVRLTDVAALVHEELDQLNSRQAEVIRRRFGIGFEDEMTLEEVGQIYGVTRERIRQIEEKGMRILRHPARMRYLSRAR